MTAINKNNKLVTLINIFTVEPAKQQQLVDLLIHATETSMRHLPGFISANIHRSLDGTKVANYAQWRSVEDFQAMQKNPAAKPHMEQAAALAKFEPGLYEVVDTQSAAPNVLLGDAANRPDGPYAELFEHANVISSSRGR